LSELNPPSLLREGADFVSIIPFSFINFYGIPNGTLFTLLLCKEEWLPIDKSGGEVVF